MSTLTTEIANPNRRPAALTVLLPLVIALFLGILIFVWVETERAHPVMLDEHGRAVTPAHESHPPGSH